MIKILSIIAVFLLASISCDKALASDPDERWNNLVRTFTSDPGSRDENGNLRLSRQCFSDTNTCGTSLTVANPGQPKVMLIVYKNISDVIVLRWVCRMNMGEDMMRCVNPDTNKIVNSVVVDGRWVNSDR